MSALPSDSTTSPRAARSAADLRAWIAGEVARATNVDARDIDTAAPLDAHGVDSLGAIGMTGGLAAYLGRDVPATLMWDYPSIDAIAVALADADPAPRAAPLPPGVIPMQPLGDRPPLFFFPGIGGHPVTFAPLAARLAPEQPCYGLCVPGLEGGSEPLAGIEAIAAEMVETIRRVWPQGPYQLAGYSFGGLLAYEAARQLTAAGEAVPTLAIYDAFAPAGRTPRPRWQRLALHAYLLLAGPGRLDYLRGRFDRLREAREVESASEVPPAGGEAVPGSGAVGEATVTRIKALNAEASRAYRPDPLPGTALVFLAATRQRHNLFYKLDPAGGWAALCGGGVRVVTLAGTHLTLLDADHAAGAADALRPHLAAPAGARAEASATAVD